MGEGSRILITTLIYETPTEHYTGVSIVTADERIRLSKRVKWELA